jgi:serine/threonine-protein phosphatase 2A regulatory subunit B''
MSLEEAMGNWFSV